MSDHGLTEENIQDIIDAADRVELKRRNEFGGEPVGNFWAACLISATWSVFCRRFNIGTDEKVIEA